MMKNSFCQLTIVLVTMFLVVTIAAGAQEDFRSVDDGRPLRVEDAYPIKYAEWEWEFGANTEIADGGRYGASGVFELKTGVARNWQLGVEAHSVWGREPGTSRTGVEELGAHLLFNVNQEGSSIPAIAFRTDVMTPGFGELGRDDWAARFRAMATRTVGGIRVHANAAYTWASIVDGDSFWSAGLALDRSLGLSSRAIMGDVYVEVPTTSESARVWADIGTRLQLSKVMVVDLGVSGRLDEWADGMPNIGITVGLSRMFGIAGLVDVPAYPRPRIK